MVGIKKVAKQVNMRRRSCAKCPFNTRSKSRCTEEVWNWCSNSFIEGFVKGARFVEHKKKNKKNYDEL